MKSPVKGRSIVDELLGKVALVTGGGGALGSVMASRFLDSGCVVCTTSRSDQGLSKLRTSFGTRATILRADMASEEDVVALYDRIVSTHGTVDIVVNTAGGHLPPKPLAEVTLKEWDELMRANLATSFLSTREALRRMAGQTYGRIINISALAGLRPLPGRIPYVISKSSVSLLTELAAQEVKGTGITVNAVAPSIIGLPPGGSSENRPHDPEGVTADEIAAVVLSLCSTESGRVTGTTLRMP